MEDIRINLENLNDKEREQFMALVEKAHKPKKKVWKPEKGETYWIVVGDGNIARQIWFENARDLNYWKIGNCFRTREEAVFHREKLIVTAALQRFADEHNEEIDWKDSKQDKYIIVYCCNTKELVVVCANMSKSNDVYFSSRELGKQAIKTVGEKRVKKYYLGVEE